MPLQYLHTSAKRGLEPGKSGFCCVARDRELPIDLARELERLSRYDHIPSKSNPIILRHLQVSIRSGNYHVLSRLRDAGTDYSKRNNHIAHHLAFTQDEAISLPDPATILLFWKGWKDAWLEPPRVLGERDRFDIHDLNSTSDSILQKFGTLVDESEPQAQVFLIAEGQEHDLALHFRNELLKLPVSKRWDVPFTNFILASDRPTLFHWSANWKGRSLPFELIANPAPPPPAPETVIASEPISPPTPQASTTSARFAKNAPTIEIPEELTRKSRRRPKRKWTRKRFAKTLNFGLGALGAVCMGIILYLFYNFNNPSQPTSDTDGESIAPIPTPKAVTSIPSTDVRAQWNSLVQAKQLFEDANKAMALAEQLAEQGDSKPLQIVRVLSKANDLANASPSQATALAIAPSLVRNAANHWELNSILASELAEQGLALLPQTLFEQLSILTAQSNPADRVYERLLHDRFLPEDAEIGLKALRRNAKDRLGARNLESMAPAEDYLALWQTLASDARLESISKVENAFEISPLTGFFAVDEDGMLLRPNQTDITQHLVELYEQFLLPRFSSFGNAPEFREALKEANRDFDSSIEAAKAIYEVLSTAQTQTISLRKRLETIRLQWQETFIRDDLMESTMINFNLERLASSKRELLQLQRQFDRQTLIDLKALKSVLNTIDAAEQTLARIDSQASWILLRHIGE